MRRHHHHAAPSSALLTAVLLTVAACTGGASSADDSNDRQPVALHGDRLVAVPPVSDTPLATRRAADGIEPAAAGASRVTVIGEHGQLGVIGDPGAHRTWPKFVARPSPDRSTMVMTLPADTVRSWGSTLVHWLSLPDAVDRAGFSLRLDGVRAELNAVSHDGELVALTNFGDEPADGDIAGPKETTHLIVADRDEVRFEIELDGNFEAEAFGRRLADDGLPAQLFLLEYFPADAPRFYRVRVLSTETGVVSLPLNLRDKTQQVDERMAGISRSQVVADEHGLLFTLYRATSDMPNGHPYAFIHTLDLYDGVWCLDIDPALELDHLDGSIAVGGDRLYVASANGHVGSFHIPSISDPSRSPVMDWVTEVAAPHDGPPAIVADDGGVYVAHADDTAELAWIDEHGQKRSVIDLPGPNPTALALDAGGRLIAAGDGWWTDGAFILPNWFGAPVALFPE